MRFGCFIVVLLLVCASVAGGYYFYQKANRPPEFVLDEIDEGDVRQIISATGSLAALKTVDVGSQISGILASVSVDFNDHVTAGQQIAQIDSSTYEAQVLQAMANLENAKANERNIAAQIENLKSSLVSAFSDQKNMEANVRKAEVAVVDAERNVRRMTDLQAKKLVAVSDLETAQTALDSAKAGLDGVRAQLEGTKTKQKSINSQIDASKAQREGSEAQIRQMEAQLSISKINLERTRIYSPIDGVVINRSVDVGQTVAASLQAPVLFSIANDLKKMQINTSVDEADIGKVKDEQRVTFTVDAYRERRFHARVNQVRLAPTVVQNVVTYAVMLDVANDDLALKPGMTANVEILVEKREKVLRVPTQALFYKPSATSGLSTTKYEPGEATNTARIWVMAGEKPEAREITIGLGNNQATEILSGSIKAGDKVVTAEKKAGEKGGTEKVSTKDLKGVRKMSRIH